ncbi:hypothetical protein K439DRAFT_1614080 [Ramaria rubella]|nr:hypothetical protein K439DRAFT_1614080 [Ramaria rubella]
MHTCFLFLGDPTMQQSMREEMSWGVCGEASACASFQALWKTMIFLNTLSHDSYSSICESIEVILTSTKDGIDFNGIVSCLRFESAKIRSANETAAATTNKRPSNMKTTCPNCSKPGHTKDKCWKPSGGDEGGGPCIRAQKLKEREDEKKKDKTESITLATVDQSDTKRDKTTTEDPCTFHETSNHFYDGYWSAMMMEEPTNTTITGTLDESSLVDWSKHPNRNPA